MKTTVSGILAALFALSAGGCAVKVDEIGREPNMTPVGYGLNVQREPLPTTAYAAYKRPGSYHSLWSGRTRVLFADPRARQVGDVITVTILMDDKAQFDNESDRSRNSNVNFGLDLGYGNSTTSDSIFGNLAVNSRSNTKGKGQIDRSEKLRLTVAAVVTEVLPNGNLLISGSQEVRVNYELRVLNIAGIVRPSDISRHNTIAYDKIAEARVAYGGRGRSMEVQQPALGHQIYDLIVPF